MLKIEPKCSWSDNDVSDSIEESEITNFNINGQLLPMLCSKMNSCCVEMPNNVNIENGKNYHSCPTSFKFSRNGFFNSVNGNINDSYIFNGGYLGKGTYGAVRTAVNRSTGKVRAVKSMCKSKVKYPERLYREIEIMKRLDHPNIVKLYETFEDHQNIYLILELCTGGELFERIISEGYFSERNAAILMKQVLSAIFYCHENKIVHRDIKPENFLFLNNTDDSPIKITDFGLASFFHENQWLRTKAGTPYYVAPEVLSGSYDEQCDLWSLGVILYILLCGYPPFYGETDALILKNVKAGYFTFDPDDWCQVSSSAIDLIKKLLEYDSSKRLTVKNALQHPWILANSTNNAPLLISPTSKLVSEKITSTQLIEKFKKFCAQTFFKKIALTVIAHQMTESEISEIKNVFIELDENGNGTLTLQEIVKGLQQSAIELPDDIFQILSAVDSDGSGSVDYTEFIAATLDEKLYYQTDVCWMAFRVFDLDGNGKITAEELKKVVKFSHDIHEAFHIHSNVNDILHLIKEADENGDGEIDFQEFVNMMRNVSPKKKTLT